MTGKKNNFEESMLKLEEVSKILKREDLSLDEAMNKFEEGQRYYEECMKFLNEAKQKIETYINQED